ncbi:AMP-dependent synthetase [Rubrobacter xylanophilus]|uniref:AMP-dependent synthetase n=1 Tax=Rubrobacter xylanophilus TaxID=49319 RepID=A0A510HKI9_9ACTN|nr:long-chain fatty acid--CoA ligase [Rubrobacter xylanophilus]BBL79815.1 AMP-dependent synthetase [Rubrobacter xylanophilus]
MFRLERDRERVREVIERVRGSRSLPEAFRLTVLEKGEKPALGEKVGGRWREFSYREVYRRVGDFAAGLAGLGVGPGSRVAIMSANRVGWTVADVAIMSLGAATVPIFPTLGPRQVEHILGDSEARVVVVEGERQLSAVRESGARVEHVVCMDEAAGGEGVLGFSEVERRGARSRDPAWEAKMLSLGREDVATLIYTSGTSGRQKGVILTHGNLLSNLEAIIEVVPITDDDVGLSILPLSHVLERTCSQFLNLVGGGTNYTAESVERVQENLLEVRPTALLVVPRLFERVFAVIREQGTANPVRARIFESAVRTARAKYRHDAGEERMGPARRLLYRFYDLLVYRKVRAGLGGRVRFCVSGGARLEPWLGEFFYGAGIPVAEGYGLTETSPVISVNRFDDLRFGTVGPPLPNVEVRLSEGGEILVRGPNVTPGYHNLPEENAAAFTGDGWFRTGDIGEFDEGGRLKITDRAKDIMVLDTGKNVAPQPVETALANAPHIAQAMLVGDGRKFVAALVVPDFDAIRRTLGENLPAEHLCSDGRARELIRSEMEEATAGFPEHERPKKFALVPREWTEEGGEITPTLKLRRSAVAARHAHLVEELYASEGGRQLTRS